MDKEHFDELVKGVREMKRHMAGKTVRGAKSTETRRRSRRCTGRASSVRGSDCSDPGFQYFPGPTTNHGVGIVYCRSARAFSRLSASLPTFTRRSCSVTRILSAVSASTRYMNLAYTLAVFCVSDPANETRRHFFGRVPEASL